METFSLDPKLIGSGRIFPNHIEDKDWIGYHCTSSYYSDRIEHEGLLLKKPIAENDIDLVADLAARLGVDSSAVTGFKSLPSISFSPISELALSYAQQSSLGGQGVGYVGDTAESILTNHHTQLTHREQTSLRGIVDLVAAIRSREPVVYAVDLKGLDRISFQILTKGVYAYTPVSTDRLVAKLCVRGEVDFSAIDTKKLKESLHNIYWSQRPHYIKQILRG